MIKLAPTKLSIKNKLARSLWQIVWLLLYRPSPNIFHFWRVFLLRIFGANIGHSVHIYPSSKVWAPWNLVMGNFSTLANNVDCYCVNQIVIGDYSTVSQYSFLCTASHNYQDATILSSPYMDLVSAPIKIGSYVWVAADVFIAPGVLISDGVVILAKSSVFRDVDKWVVVAGNPSVVKKARLLLKTK